MMHTKADIGMKEKKTHKNELNECSNGNVRFVENRYNYNYNGISDAFNHMKWFFFC